MKPSPMLCALFSLLAACATPSASANTARPASTTRQASAASVDALLAKGRALLDAGDGAAAQAAFDQAAALDPSIKTRVWVLRSWLAQGRVNDTYNAVDELAKTTKGVEIDYLYGMAFAIDAKRGIETNQAGPMTGTKIEDALQYLGIVMKTDVARFPDATLMVCWAAWESQRYDIGQAAAEKAVLVLPTNPESHYHLGRFALAAFQRDQADAAKKDAAEASWQTAFKMALSN